MFLVTPWDDIVNNQGILVGHLVLSILCVSSSETTSFRNLNLDPGLDILERPTHPMKTHLHFSLFKYLSLLGWEDGSVIESEFKFTTAKERAILGYLHVSNPKDGGGRDKRITGAY